MYDDVCALRLPIQYDDRIVLWIREDGQRLNSLASLFSENPEVPGRD
jgi:hypothetical protein